MILSSDENADGGLIIQYLYSAIMSYADTKDAAKMQHQPVTKVMGCNVFGYCCCIYY